MSRWPIYFASSTSVANILQASTRTHLSFLTAMQRLGGTVISLSPSESSLTKGETVEDTVRNMEGYCDIMVMRHPDPGSVLKSSTLVRKPIINGGDGIGEHPTQVIFCCAVTLS